MSVILGLGTNLGDRLANLRRAIDHLKKIPGVTVEQVSPIYISDALLPDNAPADWNIPYLNLAIRCEVTLAPIDLYHQLKSIERLLGRQLAAERWAPRIIDIDLLVWGNERITTDKLTIPHKDLFERPFALWPLADVMPFWAYENHTAAEYAERFGSRFSGDAPCRTRMIYQRIDTPQLMGIINVTPDSFADGGQFLQAEHAAKQAQQLMEEGADILDIGAESTAPHASAIDAATEWARLEPALLAILQIKHRCVLPPKISIDTRHASTAQKALALGIDYINDQTGLDNPAMRDVIREAGIDCIIMHHLHIPERRDSVLPRQHNPSQLVYTWAKNRIDELEQAGIARDKLIFDPGIGFGKMAEQSLHVLQHLHDFTSLGVRMLVGHSRKSFLSTLTDAPAKERDIETTACSLYLAKQPVDIVRLHNVGMCARAFRVSAALMHSPVAPCEMNQT